MTIESAKAFVERMKNDKEFAKKVIECKDVEERKKMVNDAGFEFSGKEYNSLVERKLENEELGGVVGGICGGMCGIDFGKYGGSVVNEDPDIGPFQGGD